MDSTVDLEKQIRDRAAVTWKMPPPAMSDYSFTTSDLTCEVLDFEYEKLDPLVSPKVIASSTFRNDTALNAQQVFQDTKSTTAIATWTVSRAVKIGMSITGGVGIPFFAEAKLTMSTDITWTKTDTTTKQEQQSWSWNATVPVPARTRVEASVVVQEAINSPKFSARLRFKGAVRLEYHTPLPQKQDFVWSYDIGAFFQEYPSPDVTVIDFREIEINVGGRFQGVQGIHYIVEAKEYPSEGNILNKAFTIDP